MVTGTVPMKNFNVLVLFELGATHLFNTRRICEQNGKGVRNWNSNKK